MSRQLTFYFDIMSPYCYLANVKLPDLARKHGCELIYHPMDIPAAKIAAGNYGPSNKEIPPKIKALFTDIRRWAKRYGVPFTLPKGFDARDWNIACLYAVQVGKAEEFVNTAYDKVWVEGIDPGDTALLRGALTEVGLDADAAIEYVESTQGDCEFKKSCVEAHQSDVFGAPIMVIDEQLFWGNDRLDFLEEYLVESAE